MTAFFYVYFSLLALSSLYALQQRLIDHADLQAELAMANRELATEGLYEAHAAFAKESRRIAEEEPHYVVVSE